MQHGKSTPTNILSKGLKYTHAQVSSTAAVTLSVVTQSYITQIKSKNILLMLKMLINIIIQAFVYKKVNS